MKLSLIIQGIDRLTAPARKIDAQVRKLGGGFKAARTSSTETGRALDGVGRVAVDVGRDIVGLTAHVARLAGRAGLMALKKSGELAKSALMKAFEWSRNLALGGFAAGIAGAGLFAKSVIGIASEFEQFQVILENTEGSVAKARKAMDWVKQFAKTTPYEIGEVMEAFVQLKAYGIDPMNGAMMSLGNAASGMNKGLMQAVEMLADAQTGEFERIKTFGIKAQQKGNQVKFTFMNNGKEMTKISKKSAADIQKAVLGIFDMRFKGMMDRQSRTLKGMWSNIKDAFSNFELTVADAGVFDFVKGKVQLLLDKVNELSANGTLKKWAEQLSTWLTKAGNDVWNFLKTTNWKQVGSDLADAGKGVWTVVHGMAALVRTVIDLRAKMKDWSSHDLFGRSAPTFDADKGGWSNPNAAPRKQQMSLELNVRASPGLQLTTGRISADSGASIVVNRGRSMVIA
jgi:phage tail tape-measure protein